jgi:hypothetical protein
MVERTTVQPTVLLIANSNWLEFTCGMSWTISCAV